MNSLMTRQDVSPTETTSKDNVMTTAQKQVAMVTGARTGVGFARTKQLLKDAWGVVALVRSPL
ncbi:hypothetical protein V8017_21110 [Stenotrophomonas rhizophila]|jgi:hypothetical protein